MPNWTFNDMEVNTYQNSDKAGVKEQLREFEEYAKMPSKKFH